MDISENIINTTINSNKTGGVYERSEDSTLVNDRFEYVLDSSTFYILSKRVNFALFLSKNPSEAEIEAYYKDNFEILINFEYLDYVYEFVSSSKIIDSVVGVVHIVRKLEDLASKKVETAKNLNLTIPELLFNVQSKNSIAAPKLLHEIVNKLIVYCQTLNIDSLLTKQFKYNEVIQFNPIKYTRVDDIKPDKFHSDTVELIPRMKELLDLEGYVIDYVIDIEIYHSAASHVLKGIIEFLLNIVNNLKEWK